MVELQAAFYLSVKYKMESLDIDKILNLDYLDSSNISLTKAILLFYLVLSSGFLSNLMSGQLQEYLRYNRCAKHFLGFFTLLVIIVDIAGVRNFNHALLYSLIGYSWFVLTTKLELKWSLLIISLLVVGYFYENKLKSKEMMAAGDQALEARDKARIKRKHYRMRTIILITILIVTLIGTIEYLMKKRRQYGTDFSVYRFIFVGRDDKPE